MAHEWYYGGRVTRDEPMMHGRYEKLQKEQIQWNETYYTPIVQYVKTENGGVTKVYQCPLCNKVSGTAIVSDPTDLSAFHHFFNCPNTRSRPREA